MSYPVRCSELGDLRLLLKKATRFRSLRYSCTMRYLSHWSDWNNSTFLPGSQLLELCKWWSFCTESHGSIY